MDTSQYVTFQKFNDKLAAEELAQLFKLNYIDFLFEDVSANFDVTFANNEIDQDFRIKLKKQDFERANLLLINLSEKEVENAGSEHYLFDFSTEELIEIIERQDEWSKFDFVLAKKLLKARGVDLSEESIDSFKQERIVELSKPQKTPLLFICIGYVLAIFGGLIAAIFGWYLKIHKKTLPNGEKVFYYANSTRIHGERILIIGIISFIFWLVIKFSNLVV